MKPRFFASPPQFRAWFEAHADDQTELLVGFYKRGSGIASITWPESVNAALCFGWIDGVRRNLDEERYTIRFTPRKASSTWSAININKVRELTAAGLMRPRGLEAFEKRREEKSSIYAYEQKDGVEFGADFEREFRARSKAWDFFQVQPAWYRRTATWAVISAKREETRRKRLAGLIEASEEGRTIRPLTRETKK